MGRLMALADCNNFFVSCERRRNPQLAAVPLVVLSANDGCIISRSSEVKALGAVAMAAPYLPLKDYLDRHGVVALSADHKLYSALSREVMAELRRWTDEMEQASIDEAFLNLSIASIGDPLGYCRRIRRSLWERCRIPVSIGIGPTKTICKIAAEMAKKHRRLRGVWALEDSFRSEFLKKLPLEAVWGVGKKSVAKLRSLGIATAAELANCDERWLQQRFSIRAVQTARELRGIVSFPLDSSPSLPQSVAAIRTFGRPLQSLKDLAQALTCYSVEAASRLRKQGLKARRLEVSIQTSRFEEDFLYLKQGAKLAPPAAQDQEITSAALALLRKIYQPGRSYVKAGLTLSRLVPMEEEQMTIFDSLEGSRQKWDRFLSAVDRLNREFAQQLVIPAVLKMPNPAEQRREHSAENLAPQKNNASMEDR